MSSESKGGDSPGSGPPSSLKHELRTPLNHIIGYCEMLIEEALDSGQAAVVPDLERIHTAGRHLLGVINDLFDPTKASIYRVEPSLLDHEVRTPLNQIIGYAEMLQEEAQQGGAQSFIADLGHIHSAGHRLLDQFTKVAPHWVESSRGGGVVESKRGELSGGSSPAVPRSDLQEAGNILVVDDDPGNREILRRRLERLGYTVQLAGNGRIALEALGLQSFDVMLLDLQMPEMNGYEVLRRLAAEGTLNELPVIVLSASDDTSRIVQCVEMGATDYLAKPFDAVLLHARIGACLEKKRLRDAERKAHEALARSQRHLANELTKAANYVRSLLPQPLSGSVQSEWCFQPSEQLGGDAFGHHWLDDDHLAIYLLDVCGHGVGAALLSVSVLNTIRARALPETDFQDPAQVLGALNRAFPAESQNFLYFTMWYGVYCASARRLTFASAGHPPALLLSGEGAVACLTTTGPPVGCFENAGFVGAICDIPAGARLLVFSDGVFEIFLEGDRVQTLDEFVASFADPTVIAMRPDERLKGAQSLRGAEVLEDDFSFLELRFL
jgi:sigma-B regulation protein RsbU (phosphoserine phosphatase)